MIVVGAIGLTVSARDLIGSRECLIELSNLLAQQCSSPLPAYLFGVWFALGVLGAFFVARR